VDEMLDNVIVVRNEQPTGNRGELTGQSQDQIAGSMLPPVPNEVGVQISFVGSPGLNYTIQRALVPEGPWTNLISVAAGQNGVGTFTDTNAPSGNAFYRTVHP
jgi:hypothetical protein